MPKRILSGTVVSDKGEKTVVVRVERRVKHPLYGKIIRLSKKYHAHDAANEFHIGEVVRIEECAPISKLKTWTVVDRIGAAKAVAIEIDEPDLVAPPGEPSKPAEEKAAKPAEEKAAKPVEEKPAKPAKKPVEEKAAKPAEAKTAKPAKKPAEKPAKPAKKPAKKSKAKDASEPGA
jgi:small subunit ribosomal protein S17